MPDVKPSKRSNSGDPKLRVRATANAPQGRSGTANHGGVISTREVSPDLLGLNRYRTYADFVTNIQIVAASTRYLLNLASKPTWSFDPANDTDEAKRLADLISRMFLLDLQTPWSRVVRRAAAYRLYGFSLQEWWTRRDDDGHLAIDDIRPRPQRSIERWDVDEYGYIHAVGQRSAHDGTLVAIPREKLLYLVDDSLDDSPEGLGLLRQVATACQRLMRYEALEGISFENDLRGMPVARIPYMYLARLVKEGKITAAERDAIVAPLEQLVRNHIMTSNMGAFIDSVTYSNEDEARAPSTVPMFSIETVRGQSPAAAAANNAIERKTWEIAQVFGTESLLLGKNGKGAFALSEDKTNNILMVVDGIVEDIIAQVRIDVVAGVFRRNAWDLKLMPQITTNASAYRNLKEITGALLQISQAGLPLQPGDPIENFVRRGMGAPAAPEVNTRQLIAEEAARAIGGSVSPDGQVIAPPAAPAPKAEPAASEG